MIKNAIIIFTVISMSKAFTKTEVVKESLTEAESFRLVKAQKAQEAKRNLAGGKIKKKKNTAEHERDEPSKVSPDSEVRYWQYSEE